MRGLGRIIVICLLLQMALCPSSVDGQENDEPLDLWTIRARTLTDEIVKDATTLATLDRAMLWARLGEHWWKADSEHARAWMQKAVQELEATSDRENAADRNRRLATARSLLGIIAPRDKTLSDRLTTVFTADVEHAPVAERRENADALINAALAILDSNVQKSIELGSASLHAGGSPRISSLLLALRRRAGKQSDDLFIETLAVARTSHDRDMLSALVVVAFKGAEPSDELRRRLLSVFAESLLRPQTSPEDKAAACNLASIAAPLLDEFSRLLPQQAGLVRLAITRCQPTLQPWERQQVDESLDDQPLNTVDALTQAATKARDSKTRDEYLGRAAYLAAQQKSFDHAVAILDEISSEGREEMNGTWESWRWEYASSSAFIHYQRGDRAGMYQVVTNAPAKLRAFVQITVATELAKLGDRASGIELIKESRTGLERAETSDASYGYLSLVRLYAELLPTEAPAVFHQAVAAINRAQQSSSSGSMFPKVEGEDQILSNNILLGSFNVPVSLLEMDDLGIRQSISLIESPIKRNAVRLNLLNLSLQRRRAANAPKDKPSIEG